MTDGAFPDRVSQLRARWESDPSSRVFLQLAEEYRHMGRVKEALAVLEKGLKEHPGYLSALVAKGRCHLELGEGEAARAVLERVVKQDATQMVANKLLVRAYLETNDPVRARERLDLYRLLNDGDPESEELQRRIRSQERPATVPVPLKEAKELKELMAEPPRMPREDDDPFALEPPTPRRAVAADVFDIDLAPPAPPAPPPASAAAAVPPAEPEPSDDGDLFPGLASHESRRRYLEGLAAEGLFAVAVPPEPAPPPAVAPVAPIPVAPAPPPEPAATATLGDLYLRQGHLAEAERIFQEVLARAPGNAAARAGLDRLAALAAPAPAEEAPVPPPRRREGAPLDAHQLLAGFQPGPGEGAGSGVTARKVFLLNRYLERLRQGSPRDVS